MHWANVRVKQIYAALKHKNDPLTKRTSVVHKSEFEKNESQHLWEIDDG